MRRLLVLVLAGWAANLGAQDRTPAPSPYAGWSHGPPPDPGFFPIAVWLQDPRHAARYRDAGINTYVALWKGPTAEQLAALAAAGLKLICHQNEFALSRKEDPTIIGWMHGDEPDNAQSKPGGGYGPPVLPERIISQYRSLREKDPTRPVLLNLGQGVAWDGWGGRGVRTNHPEDYAEYLKGSDLASFDIYPAVHDNPEIAGKLWTVPEGVDRLRKWGEGKKVVWNCIEASRIGNDKTKPTAAQIRTEVWMSLVHGSGGLIYFVHQFKPRFSEASLLEDPELLAGVTALNRQILSLAPVLNSPTLPGGVEISGFDADAPVDAVAKHQGDSTWVFSVEMRDKAARVSFRPRGARGRAEVLGEDRSIELVEGRFEDAFKPYEVHLYRIR